MCTVCTICVRVHRHRTILLYSGMSDKINAYSLRLPFILARTNLNLNSTLVCERVRVYTWRFACMCAWMCPYIFQCVSYQTNCIMLAFVFFFLFILLYVCKVKYLIQFSRKSDLFLVFTWFCWCSVVAFSLLCAWKYDLISTFFYVSFGISNGSFSL